MNQDSILGLTWALLWTAGQSMIREPIRILREDDYKKDHGFDRPYWIWIGEGHLDQLSQQIPKAWRE
jgi:hypothetical protein